MLLCKLGWVCYRWIYGYPRVRMGWIGGDMVNFLIFSLYFYSAQKLSLVRTWKQQNGKGKSSDFFIFSLFSPPVYGTWDTGHTDGRMGSGVHTRCLGSLRCELLAMFLLFFGYWKERGATGTGVSDESMNGWVPTCALFIAHIQ